MEYKLSEVEHNLTAKHYKLVGGSWVGVDFYMAKQQRLIYIRSK